MTSEFSILTIYGKSFWKDRYCLVISLLLFSANTNAIEQYTVDKAGKSIQLDGFLIEWIKKDAKSIKYYPTIAWDAANTPQGLAGYFSLMISDTCHKIVVKTFATHQTTSEYLHIEIDTNSTTSDYHVSEISSINGEKYSIVEWIIPWNQIFVDSCGKYDITYSISNSCSKIHKKFRLIGKNKKNTIFSQKIIVQIIVTVFLLSLFLILKRRLKQ